MSLVELGLGLGQAGAGGRVGFGFITLGVLALKKMNEGWPQIFCLGEKNN